MAVDASQLSELTTHCIRCGFCLEACPTFVETGRETESPRGRIYLVRSAVEGQLAWEDADPALRGCLGCRACETACPSGVEYGKILELARQTLSKQPDRKGQRLLLSGLTRPGRAKAQLALGRLLPGRRTPWPLRNLLSPEPQEADIPTPQPVRSRPRLDKRTLPPVTGEVAVLRGCVMRVLYADVHECTERLLRRIGFTVRWIESDCCGALHAHSGFLEEAADRARTMAREIPANIPVLTNSAGCGSTMREWHFLDGDLAGVSARVEDASVFLSRHGLADRLGESGRLERTVTYHDACHLAHGQGVRAEPRALLQAIPGIRFVELEEADRCCGSAGIYNLVQPRMARGLLTRKWEFIRATGADLIATGNPGCLAWLQQAARESGCSFSVQHTLQVLEEAFTPEVAG